MDAPKEATENGQPGSKKQASNPNLFAGGPNMLKGGPSLNPGGRPKKLRLIEEMLDAEFRTPETIREALTACKKYAFTHEVGSDADGCEVMLRGPDAGFAKIFFDRVLGPVKELEVELGDAPAEVLEYIKNLQ